MTEQHDSVLCPACMQRHRGTDKDPAMLGQYTLGTYTRTHLDTFGVFKTHFECSCEVCQFSYSGDFTRQIPLE